MAHLIDGLIIQGLKSILSDYFEDGSRLGDKIHTHAISGVICLEDLILKRSVLDLLPAPFRLVHGYIGKLKITIPWTRLTSESLSVVIEDVCILLEPNYKLNPEAKKKKNDRQGQAFKQAKLIAADLLASKRGKSEEEEPNEFLASIRDFSVNWFTKSLLTNLFNNMVFEMKNIHIRYEDNVSCPLSNFCFGLVIDSLAISPGSSGVDGDDLRSGMHLFEKSIQITRNSMYWNPLSSSSTRLCDQPLACKNGPEIEYFMLQRLMTRNRQQFQDSPGHRFLLHPLDVDIQLFVIANPTEKAAQVEVTIVIPSLDISMNDQQGLEVVALTSNLKNYSDLQRGGDERRPGVAVAGNCRIWWKYLLQLFKDKYAKKYFSRKGIMENISDKLVYIELWSHYLVSPTPMQEVKETRNALVIVKDEDVDRVCDLYKSLLSQSRLRRSRMASYRLRGDEYEEEDEYLGDELMNEDDDDSGALQSLGKMSSEMLRIFVQLEFKFNYEQILAYRALAEVDVSSAPSANTSSWLGGLISWAAGSAKKDYRKLYFALKDNDDPLFYKQVLPNQFELDLKMSLVVGHSSFSLALVKQHNENQFCSFDALPPAFFRLVSKKISFSADVSKKLIFGVNVAVKLSIQDIEIFEPESASALNSSSPSYYKFMCRQGAGLGIGAQAHSLVEDPGVSGMGRRKAADENGSPVISLDFNMQAPANQKDARRNVKLRMSAFDVFVCMDSPIVVLFDSFSDKAGWYGEPAALKALRKANEKAKISSIDASTSASAGTGSSLDSQIPPDPKTFLRENLEFAISSRNSTVLDIKMNSSRIFIASNREDLESTDDIISIQAGDLQIFTLKNIEKSGRDYCGFPALPVNSNNESLSSTASSSQEADVGVTSFADCPFDTVFVDHIDMVISNTEVSLCNRRNGEFVTNAVLVEKSNLSTRIFLSAAADLSSQFIPWVRIEVEHSGVIMNIGETSLVRAVEAGMKLIPKPKPQSLIEHPFPPSHLQESPHATQLLLEGDQNSIALTDDKFFDVAEEEMNERLGDDDECESEAQDAESVSSTSGDDEFFDAVEGEEMPDFSLLSSSQLAAEIRKRENLFLKMGDVADDWEIVSVPRAGVVHSNNEAAKRSQLELRLLRDVYEEAIVKESSSSTNSRSKSTTANTSSRRRATSQSKKAAIESSDMRSRIKAIGELATVGNQYPVTVTYEKQIFAKRPKITQYRAPSVGVRFGATPNTHFAQILFRCQRLATIISSSRREILDVTVSGIELKLAAWSRNTMVHCDVGDFQVTNRLDEGNHSAILYCSKDGTCVDSPRALLSLKYALDTRLNRNDASLPDSGTTISQDNYSGYHIAKRHSVAIVVRESVFDVDQRLAVELVTLGKRLSQALSSVTRVPADSMQDKVTRTPTPSSVASAGATKPKKATKSVRATNDFSIKLRADGLAVNLFNPVHKWQVCKLSTGFSTVKLFGKAQSFLVNPEEPNDLKSTLVLKSEIGLAAPKCLLKSAEHFDFISLLNVADASVAVATINSDVSVQVTAATTNIRVSAWAQVERIDLVLDASPAISLCNMVTEGELFKSFLAEKARNASISLKKSKSKSELKSKATAKAVKPPADLLAGLAKALDKADISFHLKSKGLVVRSSNSFQDKENIIHLRSISTGFQSSEVAFVLGLCSSGVRGVELMNSIEGIHLNTEQFSIVDPFSVLSRVELAVHEADHSSLSSRSLDTRVSSLVNVMTSSMFRPKVYHGKARELHLSVSVAPIALNFSSAVVDSLKGLSSDYMNSVVPPITLVVNEAIKTIKSSEDVKAMTTAQRPASNAASSSSSSSSMPVIIRPSQRAPLSGNYPQQFPEGLDESFAEIKFAIHIIVYETAINLSEVIPDQSIIPRFKIISRGIQLSMFGRESIRKAVSAADGVDTVALCGGANLVKTDVSISSFDVESCQTPRLAKRLVFSSPAISALDNRHDYYNAMPDIGACLLSGDEKLNSCRGIMGSRITLTSSLELAVSSVHQSLNVVVDNYFLVELAQFVLSFIPTPPAPTDAEPVQTPSITAEASLEQAVKEYEYSPITFPLEAKSEKAAGSVKQGAARSKLIPGILVQMNSFKLPKPIRSIHVFISVCNNSLWVPRNLNDVSPYSILHHAASVQLIMSIASINISEVSSLEAHEPCCGDFFSSSVKVNEVTARLVSAIDKIVYCPVQLITEVLAEQAASSSAFDMSSDLTSFSYELMLPNEVSSALNPFRDYSSFGNQAASTTGQLHASIEESRNIVEPISGVILYVNSVKRNACAFAVTETTTTIDAAASADIMNASDSDSDDDDVVADVDTESFHYEIVKSLDVRMNPIDLYAYINVSQFIDIYKDNLKHIADFAKQLSTESKSTRQKVRSVRTPSAAATSTIDSPELSDDVNEESAWKFELVEKMKKPKNLLQLLALTPFLGNLIVNVSVEYISINIIDNFCKLPQNLLRANIRDFVMSVHISSIPRALPATIIRSSEHSSEDPIVSFSRKKFDCLSKEASTEESGVLLRASIRSTNDIEFYAHETMTWNAILDQSACNLEVQLPCKVVPALATRAPPVFWRLGDTDSVSAATDSSLFSAEYVSSFPSSNQGTTTKVSLSTDKQLNLNISAALLDSIIGLSSKLQKFTLYQDNLLPSSSETSWVIIRNDTGLPIDYWLQDPSRFLTVDGNSESALITASHHPQTRNVNTTEFGSFRPFDPLVVLSRTVNLRMGRVLFKDVPLVGSGRRVFETSIDCDSDQHANTMCNADTVGVVIELSSRLGIKTLTVRSTLSLNNSLQVPVMAALFVSPEVSFSPLWEVIVPANSTIGVPVSLTGSNNGKGHISMRVVDKIGQWSADVASASIPDFPACTGNGQAFIKKAHAEVQELQTLNSSSKAYVSARNSCKFQVSFSRKGDQRAACLRYAHWLSAVPPICVPACPIDRTSSESVAPPGTASADTQVAVARIVHHSTAKPDAGAGKLIKRPLGERFNVNVSVESIADGTGKSDKKNIISDISKLFKKDEPMLSRVMTLQAPLCVSNMMACGLEIQVSRPKDQRWVSMFDYFSQDKEDYGTLSLALDSGKTHEFLQFHPSDSISLRLRFSQPADQSWSSEVIIPACDIEKSGMVDLKFADILFPNQSTVPIHVEIADKLGQRSLTLFTPFWVVMDKSLSFEIKHDSIGYRPVSASGLDLNGEDAVVFTPNSTSQLAPTTLTLMATAADSRRAASAARPSQSGPTTSAVSSSDATDCMSVMHVGYSNYESKQSKINVRIPGYQWSAAVSLDVSENAVDLKGVPEGRSSYFSLFDTASPAMKHCTLISSAAPKPFHRSKIIVLKEKFEFINSTEVDLRLQQCLDIWTEGTVIAAGGGSCYLAWQATATASFRVSLKSPEWMWSGELPLNAGEVPLRLICQETHKVKFISVIISKRGLRMQIEFKDLDPVSLFRIENCTSGQIRFSQINATLKATVLPSFSVAHYCWDDPSAKRLLRIEYSPESSALSASASGAQLISNQRSREWFEVGQVELNGSCSDSTMLLTGSIQAQLVLIGVVKTLRISHKGQTDVIHRPVVDYTRNCNVHRADLRVAVSCPFVSVCIASSFRDVLMISSSGIELDVHLSKDKSIRLASKVKQCQVEVQCNTQSVSGPESGSIQWTNGGLQVSHVLFPIQEIVDGDSTDQPFIDVALDVNVSGKGIVYINELTQSVGQFGLTLDGAMLPNMIRIFGPIAKSAKCISELKASQTKSSAAVVEAVVASLRKKKSSSQPPIIFVKQFSLGALRFLLSVDPSLAKLIPQAKIALVNSMMKAALQLSASLVKIENCEMKFTRFDCVDSFQAQLVRNLSKSIISQIPSQVGSLLHSVEAYSIPVEIVQLLGQGFMDIVRLPSDLFQSKSAGQVGGRLAAATTGAVKTLTATAFLSSSMFTSSAGKLLSVAANFIDDEEDADADADASDTPAHSEPLASVTVTTQPETATVPPQSPSLVSESASSLSTSLVIVKKPSESDSDTGSTKTKKPKGGKPKLLKSILSATGSQLRSLEGLFNSSTGFMQQWVLHMLPAAGLRIDLTKKCIPAFISPRPTALLMHSNAYGDMSPRQTNAPTPSADSNLSNSLGGKETSADAHIYRTGRGFGPELMLRAIGANLEPTDEYVQHCRLVDYSVLLLTSRSILLVFDTFGACEVLFSSKIANILSLRIEYDVGSMYAIIDVSLVQDSPSSSPTKQSSLRPPLSQISSQDSFESLLSPVASMTRRSTTAASSISPGSSNNSSSSGSHQLQSSLSSYSRSKLRALRGSPKLTLYYDSQDALSATPPPSPSETPSDRDSRQLSSRQIEFSTHEQLVDVLLSLLPLAPRLADVSVGLYLERCGVRL